MPARHAARSSMIPAEVTQTIGTPPGPAGRHHRRTRRRFRRACGRGGRSQPVPAPPGDGALLAADQALRIARRRRDVEITAVTMGPPGAVDALRRALWLGADEGVHVLDDRLHGSDALATSRVLAAAVDRLGFDLVLCGSASADS